MDVRLEKARAIVKTLKVRQRGNTWLVPSQSGKGTGYVVKHTDDGYTCDCPDFAHRHTVPGSGYCKHIYAVCLTIVQTEEATKTATTTPDGTTILTQTVKTTETVTLQAFKRPTYPQNWPAYNAAQTEEKATFLRLLHDLCAGVTDPTGAPTEDHPKGGRPWLPLADRLFAMAFKVYSTFSGRRFMTDLADAQQKGYLSRLPCYNSLFNYFESAALTPLLRELVTISSLPLAAIEQDFAVDSSGFSTCRYVRWFDTKHGDIPMERHDWIKLHLICGVTTNVVTGVECTDRDANDSPFLPALTANTARHFTLREVSADKQYSSKNNLTVIAGYGGTAYIPFKSNATGGDEPLSLWRKMYHFYSYQRDTCLAHYHQRSNAESTFSMIKAKFGAALRSKTQRAQCNEALCKVLAHNLCCVIQSMHELGIEAAFWGEAKTA